MSQTRIRIESFSLLLSITTHFNSSSPARRTLYTLSHRKYLPSSQWTMFGSAASRWLLESLFGLHQYPFLGFGFLVFGFLL
ncbi:hypothetical protein HBH56_016970 [Parastagonospora nodorum]|nr:hypothetical protein HBH56_016970 [Parastagonospora nodorum]KAH4225420.1 hypothetical protein HBI05_226540 [Parastagonospora nodorum]KAH4242214.1 hypothetical protein HBI06_017480 [Parastagonospora nodorum]KAH4334662.1 hypothetical protein HBH98_238380 [Parastagonospora nodorum]KAH4384940.1 hypothetical protein HBH97_071750 [Parastagonospora nodorum]